MKHWTSKCMQQWSTHGRPLLSAAHPPSSIRTQEFNPKLISLPPLDEAPVHVPLRRPRLLRFERLRVPVWNPYSRGRLGPAKSEDRKGGEGKVDANLTNFLSTDAAGGTPTRRHALGRLPRAWRRVG